MRTEDIKILRDSLFELTCKECEVSKNRFKNYSYKDCQFKIDCVYYKYNRIIYKTDKELGYYD